MMRHILYVFFIWALFLWFLREASCVDEPWEQSQARGSLCCVLLPSVRNAKARAVPVVSNAQNIPTPLKTVVCLYMKKSYHWLNMSNLLWLKPLEYNFLHISCVFSCFSCFCLIVWYRVIWVEFGLHILTSLPWDPPGSTTILSLRDGLTARWSWKTCVFNSLENTTAEPVAQPAP